MAEMLAHGYFQFKVNIDMAITFPQNPTVGQEFLADNTVTYVWTGSHWNSGIPIHNGTAEYAVYGGSASSVYNELLDNTLDGGGGHYDN
jgi:hypothetical protein